MCFFEGGIRTEEMSKNVAWSIFLVICLLGSVLYLQNFKRICDPDSLITSFQFCFQENWEFVNFFELVLFVASQVVQRIWNFISRHRRCKGM